MIRIAIVEDEPHYKKQLTDFLKRFEQESGEHVEVKAYGDGEEFVKDFKAQYDIILMDVQMRFLDGMAAAEEVRKMDSEVVIIFITNMAQYAIKGYAVDALDYVLKPISYFQFSQRLNRAIERMKRREEHHITLKIRGGVKRFRISDIYYIETQRHKLVFVTRTGEFETIGTMTELEEELAGYPFFRGNKGYFINLKYVEGMDDVFAIVKGKPLVISRPRRKAFMEALSNYWGNGTK